MIAVNASDSDLDATFERLFAVMGSEPFLTSTGITSEVNLFIQPYPIELQNAVEKRIHSLANRLSAQGRDVLSIHLLELVREFTSRDDRLPRLLEKEATFTRAKMLSTMARWTDPKDHLIPAMREKFDAAPWEVTLVHGCGAVFPFLRTHTILENLQADMDTRPIVFFFPGEYQHREAAGSDLRLFGKLSHKGYYRAFNLDHYFL